MPKQSKQYVSRDLKGYHICYSNSSLLHLLTNQRFCISLIHQHFRKFISISDIFKKFIATRITHFHDSIVFQRNNNFFHILCKGWWPRNSHFVLRHRITDSDSWIKHYAWYKETFGQSLTPVNRLMSTDTLIVLMKKYLSVLKNTVSALTTFSLDVILLHYSKLTYKTCSDCLNIMSE
jgi:hypothetical protein